MTSREKAHWTDEEINAFLDYLIEHQAEAGEGMSFKTATFTGAAALLAPMKVQGADKTAETCKRKWNTVCPCIHLGQH